MHEMKLFFSLKKKKPYMLQLILADRKKKAARIMKIHQFKNSTLKRKLSR